MSKTFCKNNSKTNIINIKKTSKSILKNKQKINLLKSLLNSEVREIKGKDYTDAYIRLLEKHYNKIIADSLNDKIINSFKNNKFFQKDLEKIRNKKKIILRNKSQNKIYSINKSITKSNISNSSKALSNKNSPNMKKNNKNINKMKSMKNTNNSNSYLKSKYWEDYDFIKQNKKDEKNKTNNKTNKSLKKQKLKKTNIVQNNSSEKITKEDKYLYKYYSHLLNKRKKKNENYTKEEKKMIKIIWK